MCEHHHKDSINPFLNDEENGDFNGTCEYSLRALSHQTVANAEAKSVAQCSSVANTITINIKYKSFAFNIAIC